jgi:hypothetical protein
LGNIRYVRRSKNCDTWERRENAEMERSDIGEENTEFRLRYRHSGVSERQECAKLEKNGGVYVCQLMGKRVQKLKKYLKEFPQKGMENE